LRHSGVDSSGEKSFIQHIQGKAHANKAGRYGFAGLLPNDAGIIPPLSFDPSQQCNGAHAGSFATQVRYTLPPHPFLFQQTIYVHAGSFATQVSYTPNPKP